MADIAGDGKTAAWAGKQTIHLIDVAAAKESTTLAASEPLSRMAFSPDSKMLLGIGDRTITSWNVATQAEIATQEIHSLSSHPPVFSADGNTIVVRAKDLFVFFDAQTMKPKGYLNIPTAGTAGLSSDGKKLAVYRKNSLLIFDSATPPADELSKIVFSKTAR